MTHRICLLSGDGIGPEVIDCAEHWRWRTK